MSYIGCALALLGLLCAAGEGPLFPWLNIAGAVVFAVVLKHKE